MNIPTGQSRVFVYGASGHGKVVAEILRACGTEVEGFVDDDRAKCTAPSSLPRILGDGRWLAEQAAQGGMAVALGIGDNFSRRIIAERCAKCNIPILSAVHPSAIVAPSARVGPGVVIMAQAVINPDAALGTGCIVNTAAIVEHDCIVRSFAHLSPRVALGGRVQVEEFSWLGIGASVLPGIRIGRGCIVGAGATVIHDVADWTVVVGTPARFLKETAKRT